MATNETSKPAGGISISSGSLNVGGNIVGGDMSIQGSQTITNTTQVGSSAEDIAKLFDTVYQKIQARPEDPNVDKEEITAKVKQIQSEATKGEQANQPKLERWYTDLAGMAPDIFQVALATIANPVSGLALVAQKIAAKAKATS